ncbi:MAG: Hpt domain-containing protein [Acidimicrobiales bacterium]
MDGVDEIVAEFLVESYENLERLAQELVELEHNPTGRELLASIFRTIHTIKGTSGFLGFSKLEKLTHVGENLLSRLRDGLQVMTPDIADALLAMSDAVNGLLNTIEQTGEEGEADNTALIETLTHLLADGSAPAAPAAEPAATPEPEPAAEPAAEAAPDAMPEPETEAVGEAPPASAEPAPAPKKRKSRAKKQESAEAVAAGASADPAVPAEPALPADPAGAASPAPGKKKRVGEILIDSGLISADEVTLAVHEQEMGDPRPLGEILAEHGVATEDEVDAIIKAQTEAEEPAPAAVTKTQPKPEAAPAPAAGGPATPSAPPPAVVVLRRRPLRAVPPSRVSPPWPRPPSGSTCACSTS